MYYGRTSAVFTFNEWTRRSLIDDYQVEPEKVHNVGFGISLTNPVSPKQYDRLQIVTIVRRGAEEAKGTNILLQAMPLVRERLPSATLSIVGTDIVEPIEGVECFVGSPRSKTIELLKSSALFAMPALFEPNGMVYIEALACSTPILGLRRFAFPEFAGDGRFGFVVERPTPEAVAEMLVDALSDSARLAKMGRSGYEFVSSHYRWSAVCDRMIDQLPAVPMRLTKSAF
jgi:glycosyltransferase involved in cell wall biosynthesis